MDTGAAVSCVDANLAAVLHLPIVDRQVHSGAGGRFEVNIHAAQIFLPELGWALDGALPQNPVVLQKSKTRSKTLPA